MRGWKFIESTCQLISGDTTVQITPKAAAVLGILLHNKGKVVSRQKLLGEVWQGLHVTQDLVREYIFDLRVALGDDAKAPQYIETLRGKGFRLLGGVEFAARDNGMAPADMGPEIRATVAVLKPGVQSDGADWRGFADALAGDIIIDLARHHDIAVIALNSSFAIEPERDSRIVASELQADYLVESSLTVTGRSLRVRFQLIDGKTGRHIWAEKFNRIDSDRQAVSDEIARSVVNALAGWQGELHRAEFKLIHHKRQESLNAYEHFIRGVDLNLKFDLQALENALFHLDKSLELDPRFARCWVIKSTLLKWAYDIAGPSASQLLAQSGEALERGLALDPRDATTLALSALKRARDGDFRGAREATRRAADTCGTDADAHIALASSLVVVEGDLAAAGAALDAALRFNPSPPSWYKFVEARIAFFLADYRRAVAASQAAPGHVTAFLYRCLSQAMLDETDAARCSYEILLKKAPDFTFSQYARDFPLMHPRMSSAFKRAAGRLESAV